MCNHTSKDGKLYEKIQEIDTLIEVPTPCFWSHSLFFIGIGIRLAIPMTHSRFLPFFFIGIGGRMSDPDDHFAIAALLYHRDRVSHDDPDAEPTIADLICIGIAFHVPIPMSSPGAHDCAVTVESIRIASFIFTSFYESNSSYNR